MVVYEDYKIYGPYNSLKDGRQRIVAISGKTRKTISYPKYLIEKFLNRYLSDEETVHHIDGNFLNNDLTNLVVLDRKEHSRLDSFKRAGLNATCSFCGKEFSIDGNKLRFRTKNGDISTSGLFCGKSCTGKYGKYIQLGGAPYVKNIKIDKVYTKERYSRDAVNEEQNIGELLTDNADDNAEA